MAQRFKAEQLKEMIRTLVREEIREVVGETINEVLSERYLRKLAESAVSARPRGVSDLDIQGDEEEPDEDVPHALANSILGVGQEDPAFKKVPREDHVRQFHEGEERDEILGLFFEGTRPLAEREAGAPTAEELAAPKLPRALAEQTDVWKRMVEGMEKVEQNKRPVTTPQSEEARIRKLREDLDRRPV